MTHPTDREALRALVDALTAAIADGSLRPTAATPATEAVGKARDAARLALAQPEGSAEGMRARCEEAVRRVCAVRKAYVEICAQGYSREVVLDALSDVHTAEHYASNILADWCALPVPAPVDAVAEAVAAEREACAHVCSALAGRWRNAPGDGDSAPVHTTTSVALETAASMIRARRGTPSTARTGTWYSLTQSPDGIVWQWRCQCGVHHERRERCEECGAARPAGDARKARP